MAKIKEIQNGTEESRKGAERESGRTWRNHVVRTSLEKDYLYK